MSRRLVTVAVTLAAGVALAGCGGSSADLTIYSGRNEELIAPLIAQFEKSADLEVDVRYGDSAELAATIAEEGGNSPADVFFAQDLGALGAIEDQLAALPPRTLRPIPRRFRDPEGRWTGVSGRARVIAYSTKRLEEAEVPDSVFDLTDPKWRGRVGFPPSNASFQAFVSAMRLSVGDRRTRRWLEAMKANGAKTYENNIQTDQAIDAGEIDLGLVNHYYLYELKAETPGFAVANHFLAKGDPGSLVNAAGIGILRSSERTGPARAFAEFLVSKQAQNYFAEETSEYPLIKGVERRGELPPLDAVVGPDIRLGELGGQLRSTLKLLDSVGFTT